jgi:hypothetical protein
MMKTDLTLDKKAHPLMMHLSIVSKYEIAEESFSYDPSTQTSNITSMSGSWCTRNASTSDWSQRGTSVDSDQKEDD